MRVLHVTGAAVVGGVERVQSSYIGELGARGVSCERFVYRTGPALSDFRSLCRVHLKDDGDLGTVIRDRWPDVVHLTVSGLGLGAMEEIARVGYRGGVVVSCHSGFSGVVSSRTTSVLTVVSRWLREQVRPFCDLEPLVLYNGVDLDLFSARGDDPSPAQPIVAWVGRSRDPVKGFEDFMHVVSGRALTGYGVWVADGDARVEEATLSERCGRAVRVFRGLRHESMPSFYRQVGRSGGALLLTSRFDSTPLVILEALACGCPVIAPRVGGIPEMLADGEWGPVYERGASANEIASLVVTMAGQSQRDAYLSRAADELPRLFDLRAMASHLVDVYSQAIERPVAPRIRDIDRRAIIRWHVRFGRFMQSVDPAPGGRLRVLGIPGWLLKTIAVSATATAAARLHRRSKEWHCAARALWESVGRALGCMQDWWRACMSAAGRRRRRGSEYRGAEPAAGTDPQVELTE